MLDERKADILKAVIEVFTETGQPVGSSAIEALETFSVSSATIRNDMAYLESEGFLAQPHTSAGRVPTQKGYRQFVDRLDPNDVRPGRETKAVSDFFSQMQGEIEEVLKETAGLLSRLTDYAAVVVDSNEDPATVISSELLRLSTNTCLFVCVLSNQQVLKHAVESGIQISDADLQSANQILRDLLIGNTIGAELTKTTTEQTAAAKLATAAVDWLGAADSDSERVFVDGTHRVVNAFEAVESVGKVLHILEQQLVVATLLAEVTSKGVSVTIGEESGRPRLADCSLVVSPYQIDGEQAGSIAVLGPTRMNYPQAISAVAAVSAQLGDRLSEG